MESNNLAYIRQPFKQLEEPATSVSWTLKCIRNRSQSCRYSFYLFKTVNTFKVFLLKALKQKPTKT